MTTNYDPCFGAAIAASDQGAFEPHRLLSGGPPTQWDEWLSSLDHPHSSQRLILHCHGYYSVPESIVLSARDYKQLYGPLLATSGDTQPGLQLRIAPSEAAQFIRSVLMVKTVLFVGFSMDDPYFQGFLEFVMRALWRYDPTRARAVLLLSADSGGASGAARHLGDSYGIHAYLYDPVDSSHSGLLNLFRSVADRCGTTTLSRPAREPVGSWWKERFTIARLRTEVR